MKQIALVGDLTRWKLEAEFITEMLHFTATKVVTVNIGMQHVPADLNRKDLLKLFPGETLADSVGVAISKLYTQGIADGILGLIHNAPNSYPSINRAFESLPFGLPKVALVSGDSCWRGNKDIINVFLPGTAYNLNPVIKITLCNTVFAVSGMSLCNVHNFGSSSPMVAIVCGQDSVGTGLAEQGIHYISFDGQDEFTSTLIKHGYINGLMLCREFQFQACIDIAMNREIPVVIVGKDPDSLRKILETSTRPFTAPVAIVTPEPQSRLFSLRPAATKTPASLGIPSWLQLRTVGHQYGTPSFYKAAAKIMSQLL